ncbi:MAG: hypothetical protein JSV84_16260 [Gemmatimonadota bacterium]|nr:MAG: hypothetical protein JSV84_16260 [Gemmatimonadota bacterium]
MKKVYSVAFVLLFVFILVVAANAIEKKEVTPISGAQPGERSAPKSVKVEGTANGRGITKTDGFGRSVLSGFFDPGGTN